ncbi:hypothetical protein MNEG_5432 [Monoraphidium neglectum]|uniref:S-acyltransferase n=1 Tax=Monoraphidium neglectum TaxID=145388 RepID=A0A0D2NAD4_9CHLO|nr:hypothetical protein MNEG_5432 [Monoraphidium neglectum]KIZ02531.1 hypothetical protein MNEG_5432 [Monoraphidium neglectum]|eukprot:XP_013901550.1 hypothetical protein MNEG_5432 [Monoraphidium neglectum]
MWQPLRQWQSSTRAGPDVLTVYIALNSLLAIAIGLRGLPWYLSVLMALCGAGSILLLWLTHLSDPGALQPRAEKDPTVARLEAGLPVPDGGGASNYRRDARGVWLRSEELEGWNGPLVSKYCDTCHIWRPPRAHHCDDCGACIQRFDHHCGVVGNCIGGGNHRFFAGFLVAAQAGVAISAGGCVWRLRLRGFPAE